MQHSQLDFPFQCVLAKIGKVSPALNPTLEPICPQTGADSPYKWESSSPVCFQHQTEDGVSTHVCDAASPHHPCNALYCHNGEGKEYRLG